MTALRPIPSIFLAGNRERWMGPSWLDLTMSETHRALESYLQIFPVSAVKNLVWEKGVTASCSTSGGSNITCRARIGSSPHKKAAAKVGPFILMPSNESKVALEAGLDHVKVTGVELKAKLRF